MIWDLLSFSLADMTPYDRTTWFSLIGDYNHAIWLALPFALGSTLVLLHALYTSNAAAVERKSRNVPFIILASGWIWTGAVFHIFFLAQLNWAAPWFGWLFIAQGVLLLAAAFFTKVTFWSKLSSWRVRMACLMLIAGLFIYPLIGLIEGRDWDQLETFPTTPAPLTLVTFAILILLKSRLRHILAFIPLIWAVISAAFAATLGVFEVYALGGAILIWIIFWMADATAALKRTGRV